MYHNVLNINRITDRIMALQLVNAKGNMNVLSVYATTGMYGRRE